jgi:hypothetical protein
MTDPTTDPTAPSEAAEKPDTLTRLRKVAEALDSSLLVGSNEVQPLLSALLYEAEFGDKLFQAADGDDPAAALSNLIAPPVAAEPDSSQGGPGTASSQDVADLQKVVADLQAQLASRTATSQQTQVEHETGPGETE